MASYLDSRRDAVTMGRFQTHWSPGSRNGHLALASGTHIRVAYETGPAAMKIASFEPGVYEVVNQFSPASRQGWYVGMAPIRAVSMTGENR